MATVPTLLQSHPVDTSKAGSVPIGSVPIIKPMPTLEVPKLPSYAKPGPYFTVLSPQIETQYQKWIKDNKIPWKDSPTSDYDMRGFYQHMITGDPNAQRAKNLHFPDTWKTPYHKSFSNESKYATVDAPHWKGNKLIDKTGKVIFDEDKEKK